MKNTVQIIKAPKAKQPNRVALVTVSARKNPLKGIAGAIVGLFARKVSVVSSGRYYPSKKAAEAVMPSLAHRQRSAQRVSVENFS